jgi:flagellar basal-body rod modification protein FlgD
MTVQPTQTGRPDTTAAPPPPVNPSSEMGRDTFMKLLVAELKNQDPMDPMQARDMVAQLAQLSTVEKLSGIDDKLGDLQSSSKADIGFTSAGLIGRTVTADTRNLALTDSKNPQGSYQLPSAVESSQLQVRNAAGEVVRTIATGAQKLGLHQFLWDGKTDAGLRAPSGSYTFDVTAAAGGKPVPVSTAVSGLVTEITYEGGTPQVVVGGAQVALGAVTSIAQ